MPREVEQERAGELDAVPHERPVPADHPVAPLDARARVALGEEDVPHAIHHGDPANHCGRLFCDKITNELFAINHDNLLLEVYCLHT